MLPVIHNSPLTAALRTAIAALFLSISFSYFAPSASAQAYVQLRRLNEMLLGPRFFNASQHPSVVFRADQFGMDGEKLTEVQGDLTMRGITEASTTRSPSTPRTRRRGSTR